MTKVQQRVRRDVGRVQHGVDGRTGSDRRRKEGQHGRMEAIYRRPRGWLLGRSSNGCRIRNEFPALPDGFRADG